GLEVQQTITLLQYARMVAPTTGSRADLSRDKDGGDPFFIAGPDYATQAAWLVFAQRPDAMGFYATDSRPVSDPAQASPKYAPETFAALGEVLTRLVRPYGPAIRAARPAPARVAVYASATAEWFGAASMGRVVGYDAEQTLPYAALLAMNHVPFDVLLDEDVAEGRLARYDVIVLPRAAALPAVSREALAAAVARGARLIANAPFPAPAPGTIVTAMTFDHEVQVDGALPVSERLGADAARRIDAAQATRLAPLFDRSVKQAEADTPRALVESLAAGRAMIHVVVNDHRDFGPRFGAHRLHLERGLPLRTRVSLRLDDRTAVYDALARRRLVVAPESAGWGAVGLELAAAQGALLFALPRPIGGVGLDTPGAGRRGTAVDVVIVVRDADGATIEADLPIEIEVTDPSGRRNAWSRFSTTRSADAGRARFRFTPAFNEPAGRWTVKVTDLVAGTTATRGIAIAE
ncbi:MAG: hypothetical protein JNL07_12675, partial [Rhodospirillales bacterium]|nr:hypothetical protein [Rhodospirillales bacterium]